MAEDFAKHFVDHRNIHFRADEIAELPLNHAYRCFDIAALVTVLRMTIDHTRTPRQNNDAASAVGSVLFTGGGVADGG